MEAWFLREWQRASFWQVLLRPLSWVYATLAFVRHGFYRVGLSKRAQMTVPVIIVGNITVGGTGKTPVVLALAQYLAEAGWHCGIISRGYPGRKSAGKKQQDMQNETANSIQVLADADANIDAPSAVLSDEASLLANRSGAPVYISANRAAAGRTLLHDHPEVNVLLCDDGLQHYALSRDLEICVIDGARGFGNGGLLPAGPLREPVSRLKSVDAILINSAAKSGPCFETAAKEIPTYTLTLGNESLVQLRSNKTTSIGQGVADFSSKSVRAIAGIGNPPRFFEHLTELGFKPDAVQAFPDHHDYTAADFSHIEADIILMTEKDAVKCKAIADDRMWFMRVDAILPAAFGEFVLHRLSELKK